VGGGLLRDVLSREEPLMFQPGQWYALAAIIGATIFLILGVGFKINAQVAALISIGITFAARVLSLRLNLITHPVNEHRARMAVKDRAHRLRHHHKKSRTEG
jgi:uncharacterized membrane protein YeiH